IAFLLTRKDVTNSLTELTLASPPGDAVPETSQLRGPCDRGFPRLWLTKALSFPLPRQHPRRPDQPHPVDGQPSFPREGCPTFLLLRRRHTLLNEKTKAFHGGTSTYS